MPRRKLSEYHSKNIVTKQLGISYTGWQVQYENLDNDIAKIKGKGTFVVKVDQAVKGRFKKGLVALGVKRTEISTQILEMHRKGFDFFLVEPYAKHEPGDERYLSLSQTKQGIVLSCSGRGGVDVESNPDLLETVILNGETNWKLIAKKTGWEERYLTELLRAFQDNYFVFIEINPYILHGGNLTLLDLAVEVDDTASLLVDTWSEVDLRRPPSQQSDDERLVAGLNEMSPASFSFQIINPDGGLFVLLSGGGASVTVCDEIYSAGHGKQLANYGEYSGNPTEEEAYIYTAAVLRTLLRSKASKKALFIGGAVANFTDIAKTFAGLCKAIEEHGEQLKKQGVRVVVRRGGPNQIKGLENIRKVLDNCDIAAAVYDQKTTIDAAVECLVREVA